MLLDVPQTPDVLQEKLLHFVFVFVRAWSLSPNTRLHSLANCVKQPGAFHQLLSARSPASPDDSLPVDIVGKSFDVVHTRHFSVSEHRFQKASGDRHHVFEVTAEGDVDELLAWDDQWHRRLCQLPDRIPGRYRLCIVDGAAMDGLAQVTAEPNFSDVRVAIRNYASNTLRMPVFDKG